MNHRRLINNLVKPWEELSMLLSRPLAMLPEECDFITKAESLSVAISHYPEHLGLERSDIDDNSKSNRLITDVADTSKHQKLRSEKRNSSLLMTSDFEFRINIENEAEYRFIRNVITVSHSSVGDFDYMLFARDAIQYLLNYQRINIPEFGKLREGELGFSPIVKLDYDGSFGAAMNAFSIRFKTKDMNGNLVIADPPGEWSFEIRDISNKSNKRG